MDLPDVVFVDESARFVRVEPSVTIGELNDFLVSIGWTLPVVPELDDLTIGGLVMGGGIEVTSNKHGWFQGREERGRVGQSVSYISYWEHHATTD